MLHFIQLIDPSSPPSPCESLLMSSINSLFIQETGLLNQVLLSQFDPILIPKLIQGIESLHFCLVLLQDLLNNKTACLFYWQFALSLIQKYPSHQKA